jgi:hypothetical protein
LAADVPSARVEGAAPVIDEKSRYRNLSGPSWRQMTRVERAVVVTLWLFVAIFGWCILLSFGLYVL